MGPERRVSYQVWAGLNDPLSPAPLKCPRFWVKSVPHGRRTCGKSRFTEEQIIKVLKEHAAGLSAGELCRKYGISDATFYKWRSRYGGMEVSDARKLKALEDENRKLKKLLAETMLDASTLKEMLGKNF